MPLSVERSCARRGRAEHPQEVVPGTLRADFDDVERDIGPGARERAHLAVHPERPAPRRQPRAKRVGDVHELGLFADRTVDLGGPTEISRHAHQLWVGIADVEPGEPPLPVLAHDRIAGESVLDLTEARRCETAGGGLGLRSHGVRLPVLPARSSLRPPNLQTGLGEPRCHAIDISNRYIGCYHCPMLELTILGLLKERPMHGYDIRRSLREDFGVLSNLSFGSLYPALARLEASLAVRTIAPMPPLRRGRRVEEDVPLTGSLTGERAALVARRATAKAAAALGGRSTRARKVYEITPHGEAIFEQLLEAADEQGGDPRGFSVRLAFAHHLSPQARIRLLERRRGELLERLQRGERSLARRTRPTDEYEQSIAEHAQETIANDLSWINRLLDRERRAPTGPGHDASAPADASRRVPTARVEGLSDTPIPARAGAGAARNGRQQP